MAKPAQRRFFFVPSREGGWEVVEATKDGREWELRRPGRIGSERVAEVPPPGADWMEALAPKREPRFPKEPAKEAADTPAQRPAKNAPEFVEVPSARGRPAPKAKAHARESKALPRKAVPNLSQELEDLMLKAQRSQPVPKGKVQCPVCGVILEPMRGKKVRTHDNPITGSRCLAAGKAWAEFGKPSA